MNTNTQPQATWTTTTVERPKATKAKRKYKKRTPSTTTKVARIRTLTALGYKPKEIAASLGINVQYVYSMQCKNRQDDLIKQAKQALAEQKHAQHMDNLRGAKEVLSQPPVVTAVPKFTIAQRLRALFTGRV